MRATTVAGAKQQHQGETCPDPIQARDADCHCLVVDPTVMPAEMKAEVDKVLALTVQAAIEAHGVRRALFSPHVPAGDISSIYIPREAKVIHINLVSFTALGAALRHPSLPFLIRCGSTALSRWNHYTKACGPSRDQLPELIRFSYTTSAAVNVEVATKDMEMKLKQLGVVYTHLSMRSQPID
ncbi:MAG: hypothetical protein P4M11_09475, partial [Candidatus Pacebacteria bacterium]|nr:hypothetical protein [Candidatus Paceibacterota bacterium]